MAEEIVLFRRKRYTDNQSTDDRHRRHKDVMQAKHPALIFSIAAPEDVTWLVQWERHLLPLQRAGHLRLWSERLILPGENRLQQLSCQLDQADLIVFLLSSDFFASEECVALMERALTRQHNEQVMLVPLLLRPSIWQDSPLGSLSCLPSEAQAVTSWDNADEALQACTEGIRQLLDLPMRDGAQRRQLPLPLRLRLQVIQGLRQEYRQRLDHSLQGQAAIELGLKERIDVIASSARLVFHDTEAEHPLPAGTTIIQVYDRAQFGLLLLGVPGAGKTTLLLDLVLELLRRAENNPEHPLPIVLSLSSWATKKLALTDWLSEQMYLVYGIAKKVGASWIEHDQILFLLDGLDEMSASARSACITAMNHYRAEHFVPLVVSSRSREYEQQQARLILPVAVEIQPLGLADVMTYLTQAGSALATMRVAIQTNSMLQQLMTTPLMLMIVLLIYRDQEANELPQRGSPQEQQQEILEQYVQGMLKRYQQRRIFSLGQTTSSLAWLARQMQQRHMTEFYLESLQPNWLSTTRGQIIYRWALELVFRLIFGLSLGLSFWLLFGPLLGPVFGPALALVMGLLAQVVEWGDTIAEIQPIEKFGWSWKEGAKGLLIGLGLGLYLGRLFWLSRGPFFELFFGLSMGLSMGLLFGLSVGLFSIPLPTNVRLKPNQGTRTSGRNALRLSLVFFLLFGLLFGLILVPLYGPIYGLLYGPVAGLLLGLSAGLGSGGRAYCQHYVLRWFLAQSRTLPWRAVAFLEEATNCILLQRVGGGYRFIHSLLQEYFASLNVEEVLEQGNKANESLL